MPCFLVQKIVVCVCACLRACVCVCVCVCALSLNVKVYCSNLSIHVFIAFIGQQRVWLL